MGAELVRKRGPVENWIEVSGDTFTWATRTWVPDDLLARLAESRKRERRAPLGDADGSYQLVAEVPLALALDRIPPELWEDRRAWKRLLDDRDFRRFRADGEFRRF